MKLVIFDCDGTLVDSQHMICAAMQSAYDAHGATCPPRERVLSVVGLSLREAFERLGGGEPDYPVDSLIERYKQAFFDLRRGGAEHEPLYPGAHEAVTALGARGDCLLGIATGKSQRGVRAVLGRHGLLDCFATIQTADDAPSKPHPGMVREALRDTGADAGEALVIGDTSYDMEMASAAGVRALGVGWGYHPAGMLKQSGALRVVEDYAELRAVIDRLLFAREVA